MPASRQKFRFYAVTNGREIGVYTNWPQTGDSVIGYAKAKYKGFSSFCEAIKAMITAGYTDFDVFDGPNTYSKDEYDKRLLSQQGEDEVIPKGNDLDKSLIEVNVEKENDQSDNSTRRWSNELNSSGIIEGVTKKFVYDSDQSSEKFELYTSKDKEACSKNSEAIGSNNECYVDVIKSPKSISSAGKSEMPVPGSINGSFLDNVEYNKPIQKQEFNNTRQPTHYNRNVNEQNSTIMKNMETLLQCVMIELHEIRREQHDFKCEIKEQIKGIEEKLQAVGKFVASSHEELLNSITQNKMESVIVEDRAVKHQSDSELCSEMVSKFSKLQNDFMLHSDTVKSSVVAFDKSVQSVNMDLNELSEKCNSEFQMIEERNKQMQNSLLDLLSKIDKSNVTLFEVENTLSVLSDNRELVAVAKSPKMKRNTDNGITDIGNRYSVLQEVNEKGRLPDTIADVETSTKQYGMKNLVCAPSKDEKENSETNSVNRKNDSRDNSEKSKEGTPNHQSFKKKDMVYLIGDSIAGQVNPAILGKATNTFVKKIKASKLEDIKSLSDQVRDAKMIIIHAGINNLREVNTVTDNVKTLVETVESIGRVAPQSQIVISKVIPAGDHDLDINRNIFNAECERELVHTDKLNVVFLDHGNLAERGIPVREFYRRDMIHLSDRGVSLFEENITSLMIDVLNNSADETYVKFQSQKPTYIRKSGSWKKRRFGDNYQGSGAFNSPYNNGQGGYINHRDRNFVCRDGKENYRRRNLAEDETEHDTRSYMKYTGRNNRRFETRRYSESRINYRYGHNNSIKRGRFNDD